jgi:ATP-dependent exoDNAse (exonuclease V) alpha subunit
MSPISRSTVQRGNCGALTVELQPDLAGAVDAVVLGVDPADVAVQLRIADLPGRPRSGIPAVVGGGGDLQLIDHTTAAGARLVLVGDHHQLSEIGAGGLFAALAHQLDAITLTINRRQHEPAERAAVDALRAGPPDAAVRHFTGPGRQIVHDHLEDAIDALTAGWWTDRQAGLHTAMLASNNHAVDAINAAARTRLSDAGQLYGPAVTINRRDYQVGDDILCLTNLRTHGLLNGTTARIDAITHDIVHATTDDSHDVAIPRGYAEQGGITHAYATTVHKAQGRTLDTTHVLLDDTAYREMAYVMLSRHRHSTTLQVCTIDSASETTHPSTVVKAEVGHSLQVATLRSAQKTLAQSL